MPTRRDVFLCWLLFTIAMAVVGWVLRASLPGALAWLNGALGANAVTVAMVAAWCVGAFFAYRPLLRAFLAKRSPAPVRQ
jgi:hypothetical protein